jgi:hypothetical protein
MREVRVMLIGMLLFWVGAVLFLNGLWLMGRIGDKEISVIDIFVGVLTLIIALYLAFGPGADKTSIRAAALTLLFSFTYLWVAWNRWNGADGRGLGWFCFFVAITTIPVFIDTFANAKTAWDYWLGFNWLSWGVLWFLFFLILAQGRRELTMATGALCALQGIYTGWIPGYLLLSGLMPGGPVPSAT